MIQSVKCVPVSKFVSLAFRKIVDIGKTKKKY